MSTKRGGSPSAQPPAQWPPSKTPTPGATPQATPDPRYRPQPPTAPIMPLHPDAKPPKGS